MQDWMLPRITDYWDQRADAIERFSRVLASTPEAERDAQCQLIEAAVTRHVAALNDESLSWSAFSVVDDLYQAASQRGYLRLDEPLLRYLSAIGHPYFDALTRRGYTVNYFIDNTWSRLDGPVVAFPTWFAAAKLIYICPQEIACHAFEKDRPSDEWPKLVSKYLDIARDLAAGMADRFNQERRHYVYLDIDANDVEIARKTQGKPGVIHIFRQEAPVPGSRCIVTMPDAH